MSKSARKLSKKLRIINPGSWSISTQLFSIFALIFIMYYLLQTIISQFIFASYFTQQQINIYKNEIQEMKSQLETPDDFYDYALDFYINSKIYSIILGEDFTMLPTSDYDYTIKINEISYKLPSALNDYEEKDYVQVYYKKVENENVVCRVENKTTNKYIINYFFHHIFKYFLTVV